MHTVDKKSDKAWKPELVAIVQTTISPADNKPKILLHTPS